MSRLSTTSLQQRQRRSYRSVAGSVIGLSLLAGLGPSLSHAQYPNQYPQNAGQTNGYYSPAQAGINQPASPLPGQMIASQQPAASTLEPVFVKRHNFDIPLNVNSRGANPPAEVHLFVSRDSGRSWELYSRESPNAGRFAFSAPSDGEYWFAVRPSNGMQGAPAVSPASLAPSLRVAVDTSQPKIDLQSAADASGVVNVQFLVSDNALSASGIQIYYRTDTPDAEWLSLDPNRIQWSRSGNGQLEGQIGFDPQVDWRRVSLHFVATDQAGNQTTSQKIVERPRVAGTPAMLASAPYDAAPAPPVRQPSNTFNTFENGANGSAAPTYPAQPYANQSSDARSFNSGTANNADTGYAVVNPQPVRPQTSLGMSTYQAAPVSNDIGQAPGSESYQTSQQQVLGYRGMSGGLQAQASSQPQSLQPQNLQPQHQPATVAAAPNSSLTPAANAAPRSPSSAFRAIEAETLPAPTQRQANPVASDSPALPFGQSVNNTASPVTSPAISNSNQSQATQETGLVTSQSSAKLPVDESEINFSRQAEFSLDYEFDSIGSRGIKKVELWGTRDAGATWDYWGADPDNEPPFDVSVSGQGLYGFRIVVVDGQNLTSPTPQPGDEAEIYIHVDKTAPIVKLVSASYGEGEEAGSLVIEYTYSDENPVSRPISLSFSDTPSGPWTTIATGLENTGRYVWQIDPRLPKNLYLRVEATDRAGNTGIEVSPNAVSLRGLSPTARIKGFQPLSQDR